MRAVKGSICWITTHQCEALLLIARGASQVKVLEESLEQAKLAESGRNALIKQVNKLEEEVKHSRHMLDKRHAEALVIISGPLVEQRNICSFSFI